MITLSKASNAGTSERHMAALEALTDALMLPPARVYDERCMNRLSDDDLDQIRRPQS